MNQSMFRIWMLVVVATAGLEPLRDVLDRAATWNIRLWSALLVATYIHFAVEAWRRA